MMIHQDYIQKTNPHGDEGFEEPVLLLPLDEVFSSVQRFF